MEKKIFYQFIIISVLLTFSISAISLYNLKNNSLKSSIHNAEQLSEVIKNGLTAHMINANMNQVDAYINSISNVKNITKFWIVRNTSVEEQYGLIKNSKARDEIDKKVLETGQTVYELNERLFYTNMRITVPYKVAIENGVNCLSCHNASQGDTLGAISMELDMSEAKDLGLETIYLIPILMIIGTLLILFIFKRKLEQYSLVFDNLSKSLNFAATGKFRKTPYPI